MSKKRTWKYWTGRIVLLLLFVVGVGLVNLIWFKPFSIRMFYDKMFVELAFESPEMVTSLGIPVIYDMYKDELDDASDAENKRSFARLKKNYATLQDSALVWKGEAYVADIKNILVKFLGNKRAERALGIFFTAHNFQARWLTPRRWRTSSNGVCSPA